jgi:hypothetical protein
MIGMLRMGSNACGVIGDETVCQPSSLCAQERSTAALVRNTSNNKDGREYRELIPKPEFHAFIFKPKYTPRWQAILSPVHPMLFHRHAHAGSPRVSNHAHLRPAVTEEKPRTVRE